MVQSSVKYVIDFYNAHSRTWEPVSVRFTLVESNNRKYMIARLGTLAKAIGRTNACIVKWEKAGKFPKPKFRLKKPTDPNCQVRWYSLVQILETQRLFRSIIGNDPRTANNQMIKLSEFFDSVGKVWDVDDRPPREHTEDDS